jgi:hypothetical protein
MTRCDTYTYDLITLPFLDPKRPELTELAKKETIPRNDLDLIDAARAAPKK